MDVGEMHIILNKIDKLEAILFGVQSPYDHWSGERSGRIEWPIF